MTSLTKSHSHKVGGLATDRFENRRKKSAAELAREAVHPLVLRGGVRLTEVPSILTSLEMRSEYVKCCM